MTSVIVNRTLKNADQKFGNTNEKNILKLLNDNISDNIRQYTNYYSIMDYYDTDENENIIAEYELKSRRIKHNQYNSLIFGKNKFDKSITQLEKNIKQIYLFNCIDGVYKWELTDAVKQQGEYYFSMNGNYARNDKPHSVCNIRTKYLQRIF